MEIISIFCALWMVLPITQESVPAFRLDSLLDPENLVVSVNMNPHHKMPKLPRFVGIASCLLLSAFSGLADDKPRVALTVSKRTIAQPSVRTAAGEETGRRQTLSVVVENLSSRASPEGSLRWTAVVRKVAGGSYKYSGTEVLPPLRAFRSAEIQCGVFEISAVQGVASIERDRIDYEMVVLHDERESGRTVSTSTFAALTQKAEAVAKVGENGQQNNDNDEQAPKKPKDEKPAAPATVGAEKMPPQKPAIPVANVAKPTAKPVAEPPPPPSVQPVDFFNLGGKKAPASK